jgi:hypothetical protein
MHAIHASPVCHEHEERLRVRAAQSIEKGTVVGARANTWFVPSL